MGIKTVPQPPYSSDLGPCDFWLFPKLTGCHYETIEEMKESVTKVIDTLTQQDFHGASQKLYERYKCIAAGGDYFEGDLSFMCVLSIKVPIRKKFETYLIILIYVRYIYFWFGWVLLHINRCRLFNGKSSLYIYIKCMCFVNILLIMFLNEPKLILFHIVLLCIMKNPIKHQTSIYIVK